ncbi:complement C1r subcomponent [Pelodytes ibericus]
MRRVLSCRYRLIFLLLGTVTCSPNKAPLYGVILSPNYPEPYPNNNQTTWDIAVPEGYYVSLNFLVFDLEPSENCNYDVVKVFTDKEELGRFCGPPNSRFHPGHRRLVSQGNKLRVQFESDFSNEDSGSIVPYQGFQAYYQARDRNECVRPDDNSITWIPPCQQVCHNYVGGYFCSCFRGYKLQSDQRSCKVECSSEFFAEQSGLIYSPGYPQPYPPDLHCNYSIRLEKGLLITLSFQDLFEIDDHPLAYCPYDTLKIFTGEKILDTFCGRRSPGVLKTNSNSVDIVFDADESGESRGWKLHYSSQPIQCPTPVPRDKFTIISPAQKEYRMREYIVVTCQTGYKLMAGDVEQEGFTSLCQRDGTWHRPIPHCEIVSCNVPEEMFNGQLTVLTTPDTWTYLSVISYNCNAPYYSIVTATGSATFTCSAQRKWMDENGGVELPRCIPVCGQPWKDSNSPKPRIIGGQPAENGEFPWQVLLAKNVRAGGAIIGEHWVLTAAHVLTKDDSIISDDDTASNIRIFFGDVDVDKQVKAGYRSVAEYYVHPQYNKDNYDNDIALIRLQKPVVMNENVSPICLPEPNNDAFLYQKNKMGYVSGYGVTETGMIADSLRYVSVPMAGRDRCKDFINDKKAANTSKKEILFSENMFCAGFPEQSLQKADSCQGDSGGAHATVNQNKTWVATGIVSWGISCGRGYGFYTKVTNYLDWILGYTGKLSV